MTRRAALWSAGRAGRDRAAAGLLVLLAFAACESARDAQMARAPTPAPAAGPTASPTPPAASTEAGSGAASLERKATAQARRAFCVPSALREAELDGAWQEQDRVVICLRAADPADAGAPPTGTGGRRCLSVDRDGRYRWEGDKPRVSPPPLPVSGFRAASADGSLVFRLVGGLRAPHGATGVLSDARGNRVLKRAPVAYDEHVAFLGWVGQAIVLQRTVDEGPGCVLNLYDPQKGWPSPDQDGISLAGCYGGFSILQPRPGVLAVVDALGGGVNFVDESTLAITKVDTGYAPDPVAEVHVAAWLEGEVLVQAYGPPWSGDVSRLDLKRSTSLGHTSPTICPL